MKDLFLLFSCFLVSCSSLGSKSSYFPLDYKSGRSTIDLPDDSLSPQIHLIYAIPFDGVDNQLDLNGKIANSVSVANRWFKEKSKRGQFRFDTHKGLLDITFVRLKEVNKFYREHGKKIRETIELELLANGFNHTNKIYAVYYDGHSDFVCANAPYPPLYPGNIFVLYLKGGGKGYNCAGESWASEMHIPKHREFSLLHEIIHSLGFVPRCAPHFYQTHANDDPRDLMYAGKLDWRPSELDIGNDDYYNHQMPDCLDLKDSTYLETSSP